MYYSKYFRINFFRNSKTKLKLEYSNSNISYGFSKLNIVCIRSDVHKLISVFLCLSASLLSSDAHSLRERSSGRLGKIRRRKRKRNGEKQKAPAWSQRNEISIFQQVRPRSLSLLFYLFFFSLHDFHISLGCFNIELSKSVFHSIGYFYLNS